MRFHLEDTLSSLNRTPATLDAMLRGLPREWQMADEGPGSWSPLVVMGHLIHGEETDWVPRARTILKHGEAMPFKPFDRNAQFQRFQGWSMGDLLDRFAKDRAENVALVKGWNLSITQLNLTGTHPDFGQVSLRQLLATWAVHDMSHIAQISRVLAKGYAQEIGPWKAYLSVLRR